MEQIEKEIDYIILYCIAHRGFDAMPQNHAFLARYSLLNIYIDILTLTTNDKRAEHFEEAAKAQAAILLDSGYSINALREYLEKNGRKATKALFAGNSMYWSSFLKVLKNRNNGHTQADKTDY